MIVASSEHQYKTAQFIQYQLSIGPTHKIHANTVSLVTIPSYEEDMSVCWFTINIVLWHEPTSILNSTILFSADDWKCISVSRLLIMWGSIYSEFWSGSDASRGRFITFSLLLFSPESSLWLRDRSVGMGIQLDVYLKMILTVYTPLCSV